jgi:hypothetical protein
MSGAERAGPGPLGLCRRAVVVAVAAALVAHGGAARAESPPGPSATQQAAAEVLFVDGKKLVEQGAFGRACAKFAESQRLDPAAGTLLNLADCYERNGQLASAWVTFRDAVTASERDGREEWAEQARSRARLLDPRVPTFTVDVDPARAGEGLEITRDGSPVAPSSWGSAIPIDPTTSRFDARAPDKKPWTLVVTVDDAHPHALVSVPPLEDLHAAPQPAAAPEPARRSLQKPVSIGLAGAGVVSIGLGVAFGVTAIAKNDTAASRCPPSNRCTDSSAVDLTSQAKNFATASTVAFAAGGALFAAGAVLFLTAPRMPAGLRPQLALGGGTWSASLAGRF